MGPLVRLKVLIQRGPRFSVLQIEALTSWFVSEEPLRYFLFS